MPYRALKVCHIDRKLTLKPAEAGASSGAPWDALLTSKCVKFIGSDSRMGILLVDSPKDDRLEACPPSQARCLTSNKHRPSLLN